MGQRAIASNIREYCSLPRIICCNECPGKQLINIKLNLIRHTHNDGVPCSVGSSHHFLFPVGESCFNRVATKLVGGTARGPHYKIEAREHL